MLAAVKNGPHAKIGPWLGNFYEEQRATAARGGATKDFRTTIPLPLAAVDRLPGRFARRSGGFLPGAAARHQEHSCPALETYVPLS